MTRIQGYRITGRFTVACVVCGLNTTTRYARNHHGRCKACTEGTQTYEAIASKEEQNARYIDCGPQAWDDRD
jgi:hypothetical protein